MPRPRRPVSFSASGWKRSGQLRSFEQPRDAIVAGAALAG
jgi:hypothetical protein